MAASGSVIGVDDDRLGTNSCAAVETGGGGVFSRRRVLHALHVYLRCIVLGDRDIVLPSPSIVPAQRDDLRDD